MASSTIFNLGNKAKEFLTFCVANADDCMQLNDITEGAHTKRMTKYVSESQNWELLIDVADILKGVSGQGNVLTLKKGIIIALALIHSKSKTDLQVKLSALAALGEQQLVNYKAVLAKAGKTAVDGLGIQATLRNFEAGPETYAKIAVDALKLVLQRLPEVNKRLRMVPSDSTETGVFTLWFGDHAMSHAKVSANFAVMADAVEKRHVILSFDGTGCQDTQTGGYVYKNSTTDKQLCNIHLCRKIFADNPPAARIAATIMHELSHAAAKTADVGGLISYGERVCQDLASKSPAKAADNADNYRWYAFPEVAS